MCSFFSICLQTPPFFPNVFSIYLQKKNFLDIEFLVSRFLFRGFLFILSVLQIDNQSLSSIISAGKSTVILLRISYAWSFTSHLLLSRFSFSLAFDSLIMSCLGVSVFMFILLRIHCFLGFADSCISSNMGHFQPPFLQIISLPVSILSSFRDSHTVYIDQPDGILYNKSLRLGYF